MTDPSPIKLLVPSMPTADQLWPWLQRIDGQYTNFGPLCRLLERELGELIGASHVISVANCTLGLELALECSGIPRGGRVLVPSLTFPATASAIARAGLTPVFGDVDENTLALTPAIAAEAAARDDIRGVLTAALYGFAHNSDEWDQFTDQTGLPVLIDAAGAIGHQKIGSTTRAVFSLHTTKPLSTGEGGVVAAASADFAEAIRCRSNFGFRAGESLSVGTNAKLSEYHAAVGLAALSLWSEWRQRRQTIYDTYVVALANPELQSRITLATMSSASPHLCVRCRNTLREGHLSRLSKAGIETRRWYWPPLHRHPAFAAYDHAGDLDVTEKVSDQLLGLPFHLKLKPDDIFRICDTLCLIAD